MTGTEDIDPVQKSTQTTSSGNVYVVDPWIRPPRGEESREAVHKARNFDGYSTIQAAESDRIMFVSRPIEPFAAGMDGNNIQRHGVYVVTDLMVYDDDVYALHWNGLIGNLATSMRWGSMQPVVQVTRSSSHWWRCEGIAGTSPTPPQCCKSLLRTTVAGRMVVKKLCLLVSGFGHMRKKVGLHKATVPMACL